MTTGALRMGIVALVIVLTVMALVRKTPRKRRYSMNCIKNCVSCVEAGCASHPLRTLLKVCHKCGKKEVLTITEHGAIASCPNDKHPARILRAAGNVWAAMGC